MKTGILKLAAIVMLSVFAVSSPAQISGNSSELISSDTSNKPYRDRPHMHVHEQVKVTPIKNTAPDSLKVAKEDVTQVAAPDTAMAAGNNGGYDKTYTSSNQGPMNSGNGGLFQSTGVQFIYTGIVAGLALIMGIFLLALLLKDRHKVEHK
jgi:hypothetical protein